MNKVMIEIEPPDGMWRRGSVSTDENNNRIGYEARFCRDASPGGKAKPSHRGPTVTVVVKDETGKEIRRIPATIYVESDGTVRAASMTEAPSDLELPNNIKKDKPNG